MPLFCFIILSHVFLKLVMPELIGDMCNKNINVKSFFFFFFFFFGSRNKVHVKPL